MRRKRNAFNRRAFLAGAWGAGPALLAKRKRPEPRFHVLFLAIDDLRPALGCYGDPLAQTPNIDRLATRGLTFLRAYCQQAADRPSRTSVLSGLRPDSTGVHDDAPELRPNPAPRAVTLPAQFQSHGYAAATLGTVVPEAVASGAGLVGQKSWHATDANESSSDDEKAARDTVRMLNAHRSGRMFLATGFRTASALFRAPKKYFDLYSPDEIQLAIESGPPDRAPAYVMHDSPELRRFADIPESGPIPPEKARELIRAYYASVSYTDAQLGRILGVLDSRGLTADTAIVLWGDSGYHLGEHGLWGKRTNFEAATRTPLIVSFPGQRGAGRKTSALTELVDIYPSLCDICQVPHPSGLEGSSFTPLFDNPDRLWKRAVFSQYPRFIPYIGPGNGYSMRTKRYRYTEWTVPERQFRGIEVYDYQRDPHESRNIALRAENVSLVNGLAGMLQEGWRESLPPTHSLRS